MAETTLASPPPGAGSGRGGDTGGNDNGNGTHPLRRRRALPGGRAVAGGFLVALAAIGIFAGYTGATADTRERYVVARHDLALGHRLVESDLGTLLADLPPQLRARSYRATAQLVGGVVVGPVAKGELVQSSDVLSGQDGPLDRQISFPIDSARAVDGQLRRGELVDVVATYGTGADGYTVIVVAGARVAGRSQQRRALAEGGDEVVTLSVPAATDALAVAHAVSAGTVTLVRAGGHPSAAGDGAPPTYRAPAVPAGASSPGGG